MPSATRKSAQEFASPKTERVSAPRPRSMQNRISSEQIELRISTDKPGKPLRAKLFQNGRSQAVRLPKEFRFEGKEVQIMRQGEGILLTPVDTRSRAERWKDFLTMLDRYADLDPIPGGRNQGVLEPEDIFGEDWV